MIKVIYKCECKEEIKYYSSRTAIPYKLVCKKCGYMDRIYIKEEDENADSRI